MCLLYLVPAVSGGGPSRILVTEETAVSLVVSWVPPNAHVLQYRVSYTALTAAETQDSTVSGRDPVSDPDGQYSLRKNKNRKGLSWPIRVWTHGRFTLKSLT